MPDPQPSPDLPGAVDGLRRAGKLRALVSLLQTSATEHGVAELFGPPAPDPWRGIEAALDAGLDPRVVVRMVDIAAGDSGVAAQITWAPLLAPARYPEACAVQQEILGATLLSFDRLAEGWRMLLFAHRAGRPLPRCFSWESLRIALAALRTREAGTRALADPEQIAPPGYADLTDAAQQLCASLIWLTQLLAPEGADAEAYTVLRSFAAARDFARAGVLAALGEAAAFDRDGAEVLAGIAVVDDGAPTHPELSEQERWFLARSLAQLREHGTWPRGDISGTRTIWGEAREYGRLSPSLRAIASTPDGRVLLRPICRLVDAAATLARSNPPAKALKPHELGAWQQSDAIRKCVEALLWEHHIRWFGEGGERDGYGQMTLPVGVRSLQIQRDADRGCTLADLLHDSDDPS